MTPIPASPILLLGRILGSAIFISGGWAKLMAMSATVGYFTKIGLPLPQVAFAVAVAVELGGGLLLLLGLFTRPVAVLLAVFCVATALIAHSNLSDRVQEINFMKNLAMTGGYLAFAVVGAGAFSLDAMLRRRTMVGVV